MILYLGIRIYQGNLRLIDSDEYFKVAELIKSGKYFSFTSDYYEATSLTKRPFLYPLFLILGLSNDLVVVLLQTLIGFLNFYLILRLFKKLGGKSYKLLTLLILLTPSIFIYTHLVMTETLVFTVLLLLAFLLFEKLNAKRIFWIQPLLVILIFLKPAFYLFSAINLIFFMIYFIRTRTFQISVLIPLAVTLAYIGFNEKRTDYAHFSSIQNINLIDYNLYLFKMKTKGIEAADTWRNSLYQESENYPTFASKSHFFDSEGKKAIKENFISYSFYHFYGAIRGTVDPGRFDLMTFDKDYKASDGFMKNLNTKSFTNTIKSLFAYKYLFVILCLIPIFIANLFKWLFVFRHLWQRRKFLNFSSGYLIILVAYSILISGPVNACRYMVPLQGIVIAIAVLGWENSRHKKSSTIQ